MFLGYFDDKKYMFHVWIYANVRKAKNDVYHNLPNTIFYHTIRPFYI